MTLGQARVETRRELCGSRSEMVVEVGREEREERDVHLRIQLRVRIR